MPEQDATTTREQSLAVGDRVRVHHLLLPPRNRRWATPHPSILDGKTAVVVEYLERPNTGGHNWRIRYDDGQPVVAGWIQWITAAELERLPTP